MIDITVTTAHLKQRTHIVRRLTTNTKRIMDSVFNVHHYSTRDIWCMYQARNVYVVYSENNGRNHVLLISCVRSSSADCIRFNQPWAVMFWYAASEFSGLQFPKVLFVNTAEVITQGNIHGNPIRRFGAPDNGRFIIHLYNRLEFGEPYDAMGFILNRHYSRQWVSGKVLLYSGHASA
jgi:hypothetical protein